MGDLILADFRPMGISFHAVVVFGLGYNLLFKSVLEHCETVTYRVRNYHERALLI